MEHEGDGDTSYNWCTWNNPERLGKGTEQLGNKRASIIKIDQNTEKSPEDCHSISSEKLSANIGMKNSQRSKIIIDN